MDNRRTNLFAQVEAALALADASQPRWLVYDPGNGWTEHVNRESAVADFEDMRERLVDASIDGWPEDAEAVCMVVSYYNRSFRLEKYAEPGDGTEDGANCERNQWAFMARGVVDEHADPVEVLRAAVRVLLEEVDLLTQAARRVSDARDAWLAAEIGSGAEGEADREHDEAHASLAEMLGKDVPRA